MDSLATTLITLACIFSASIIGLFCQSLLPEHHLQPKTQDTVKLTAGLIATMAALVLGLMVGSSKSSFDATNAGIIQIAAKIVMFDRLLAQYGPDAQETREALRISVAKSINRIWPEEHPEQAGFKALESGKGIDVISEKLGQLSPKTDSQRSILSQVMQLGSDITLSRWVLMEQQQNQIPAVLLVVLVIWLSVLSFAYGLFAPRNLTVVAALFISSLSVSASILLIIEMNRPLDGLIKVSSAPMHYALKQLGN